MPTQDSPTDDDLIDAANVGDVAAFETLYRRYRDWVLRLAYRYTRNREDALDVAQEAFLYLLRRFPGFNLTARMTTLLFPVVRNLAATRARRRVRESAALPLANIPPHAEPADPSAAPDSRTAGSDLPQVLDGLPEAQREVLMLRFVDDMTLEEIAAALDIPLGTVKSRLHGAIGRLRADPRILRYFEI